MRKYSDNPVEHFQVRAVQGFPQPAEKCDLRRVQRPTVKMKPLRHSDAAMMTLDGFNRIGAGQYYNVPANCPGADVKLMTAPARPLVGLSASTLRILPSPVISGVSVKVTVTVLSLPLGRTTY